MRPIYEIRSQLPVHLRLRFPRRWVELSCTLCSWSWAHAEREATPDLVLQAARTHDPCPRAQEPR